MPTGQDRRHRRDAAFLNFRKDKMQKDNNKNNYNNSDLTTSTPAQRSHANVNGAAQAQEDINSICVFCGSGSGADKHYQQAAQRLGHDMAKAGMRLVYGGGSLGLMGEVARAVLKNQGTVTGIIPAFLSEKEQMLRDVDELIVTENMHERKALMFEKSDAFVALPGGIGTLEELVEQLTWSQLGRHNKPIILANIDNFWDPLMKLLRHMSGQAFIRPGLEVAFTVVDKPQEIVPAIISAATATANDKAHSDELITAKF